MDYLWLTIALPLLGFLFLGLLGRRMPPPAAAILGVATVGLSAAIAAAVSAEFLLNKPAAGNFSQTLWIWIDAGTFKSVANIHLDPLSLVMMLVVTFVGFLIHLYSMDYMRNEEGYHRFFAYMNLFVASMLILVLAGDILFLYVGWEGVGLCSYLLIGFWHRDPANVRAARKAFLVTRIGDTAFAIGIFALWNQFGTLQIDNILQNATRHWTIGSPIAVFVCALLLGGAVGKSAQLPLQIWLPDAMAGPTPVSALIHAATMVTAGVYLIARTNPLFVLAPPVQMAVAIIGAATLLIAGLSAVTQSDIKRVLAYSTISQIGYMFLALGVGAWPAAIFHLTTHAFFKALLFLAAGVLILRMHHEQDMFKMGGLRRRLPFTFTVFLIGALALAGLPPGAGFASKELILDDVWGFPNGGHWLWAAGLIGTFLTGVYTFRMVFLTFFGESTTADMHEAGRLMGTPLAILALLSLGGAALNWLHSWGGIPFFTNFLNRSHPASNPQTEWPEIIALIAGLAGIPAGWLVAARDRTALRSPVQRPIRGFFAGGWGFDWFYDLFFVQPFLAFTRFNREDFMDRIFVGITGLTTLLHRLLSWFQSGRVSWYALGVACGAAFILGLILFL